MVFEWVEGVGAVPVDEEGYEDEGYACYFVYVLLGFGFLLFFEG